MLVVAHRRLRDPEQIEVLLVARVVDARDRLADAVGLLRDLRDHEVVLVVARHGEEELGGRAIPARSRTAISVASPRITVGPNSSSSRAKRSGRCSMSVTSWPRSRSVRVTFEPDLASARDDDVHQAGASSGRRRTHRVEESADGGLRRADDAHAAVGVELRAALDRGRGRRRCRCS